MKGYSASDLAIDRPFYSQADDTLGWYWEDDVTPYAEAIFFDGQQAGSIMRDQADSTPCGVKIYGVRQLVGPKPGEWVRGYLAGFASAASIWVVALASAVAWTLLR